jgi:hypothetical protein
VRGPVGGAPLAVDRLVQQRVHRVGVPGHPRVEILRGGRLIEKFRARG